MDAKPDAGESLVGLRCRTFAADLDEAVNCDAALSTAIAVGRGAHGDIEVDVRASFGGVQIRAGPGEGSGTGNDHDGRCRGGKISSGDAWKKVSRRRLGGSTSSGPIQVSEMSRRLFDRDDPS